jgi:hypothetical protein
MLPRTLIAGLLFSAVSACNNPPAPQSASHPPAVDLTCQAEAPALTDAQVIADTDGSLERGQTTENIIAGRSCRDALHRVCQWHKDRGDSEVDCDKPAMGVQP